MSSDHAVRKHEVEVGYFHGDREILRMTLAMTVPVPDVGEAVDLTNGESGDSGQWTVTARLFRVTADRTTVSINVEPFDPLLPAP